MLRLDDLTKAQKDAFRRIYRHRDGEEKLANMVLQGDVRSTKTACESLILVDTIAYNEANDIGNHQYLLGGHTISSVRRNCEAYLREASELYGFTNFAYIGGNPSYYRIGSKSKVFVFAGSQAPDWSKVRGVSVHSAYLDEAVLLKEDFIAEVQARLISDSSFVVFTTNPHNPYNHFKLNYINDPPPNTWVRYCPVEENHHIPRETIEQMKASLDENSPLYRRMFNGEWVATEGMVVRFDDTFHTVENDKPLHERPAGVIGFDPGAGGVCAAVYLIPTEYGYEIADEYRHDAARGQMSDAEHIAAILSKGWNPQFVVLDPMTGANASTYWSAYGIPTSRAVIEVLPGIHAVNEALFRGRLKVNARCIEWRKEQAGYVWQVNKTTGFVQDRPVKGNDHLMDSTRYIVGRVMPAQVAFML